MCVSYTWHMETTHIVHTASDMGSQFARPGLSAVCMSYTWHMETTHILHTAADMRSQFARPGLSAVCVSYTWHMETTHIVHTAADMRSQFVRPGLSAVCVSLKAYSLTSLDTSRDSCPSLGVSHGAGQLDGDLHRDSPLNITTKLVFVLQIQEITVTGTKSMC